MAFMRNYKKIADTMIAGFYFETRVSKMLLILMLFVIGCKTEPLTVSWTPVDNQAIVDAMAHPTGKLVSNDFKDTQKMLENALGLSNGQLSEFIDTVEIIYNQIAVAAKAIDSSSTNEFKIKNSSSDKVQGSRVYLKISCIGSDIKEPVTDFSKGKVYIEGASFAMSKIIKNGLVLSGDMLLRFEECHIADITLRGDSPGFIDPDKHEITIDMNVTVSYDRSEIYNIMLPIIMHQDGFSILIDDPGSGTYVLSLNTGDEKSLTLHVSEGKFVCSFTGTSLNCSKEN